jgi:RNA polymerase sigma-70 factor (ECF subfamily)
MDVTALDQLANPHRSAIVAGAFKPERRERPVPADSATLPAAAWMARYCDGDVAAFHALYDALAPRLLGYLTSLIGERAAAEDLLQLTFLKLHQSRDVYVRGADPVPWLYTIAHRTFLDETRRRKRSRVKLTDEGQLPEPTLGELAVEPEGERGPDPELTEATLGALSHLPPNQREALVLTKLHGHSLAEAAAIVGTTPSAIKLRAHRAYVTLRRLLGRSETP